MIYIHANEVNNIAEYNSLHDIINLPKCAKYIKRHYSTILHGCMNTKKGRVNIKNSQILLDSGFSSPILMRTLLENLQPKKML